MSRPAPATLEPPNITSADRCYHCGEPCASGAFALAGKSFCCLGCQTVFTLLRENGLEQFYALNSRPGIRIRNAASAGKWTYLDDPLLAEQLLDFADQSQAKITMHLPGIHCVACVWLLENLFKLHPGVGSSQVNFSRREAAITFAPDKIKLSELAALLESLGYEPEFTLGATDKAKPSGLGKKTWLQIGLAGFSFGNIMLMSLPFYLGLDSFSGPWFKAMAGWLGLALAFPVVTFSASDFWRGAWISLRQSVLTMEVPIALGLASLYAASAVEVFSHRGPGYCDSLCGLIFFLLCGRVFQRKTHERLVFDRDYKGFFPLSVTRKTACGEECIPISRLEPGNHIILRNGELLPADARLIHGEAWIDYSFVTGESEPVERLAGARLYAGGRQTGGAIEVETIKPVAQSYLASLWDNEAFRKNRDNDLDSLTNRYSKYFTQLIASVAVGAAFYWLFRDAGKALNVFTAVLIVACPCALALAAPLTQGTAQRILARLKIFLRNAAVLERMAEIDTLVLDKTGTLTSTDAQGVAFYPAGAGISVTASANANFSPEERTWMVSVARQSAHPHSLRIAKALGGDQLPVAGFAETPGQGIVGEVGGRKLLMGSRVWMEAHRVEGLAPAFLPPDQSGSLVYVAIDGVGRGAFVLDNTLRPEVRALIRQLSGRYQLALLSGDNEREAARFEKIFNGQAILRFNQSPADKLEFIRQWQQRGRKVMMVGDGLNDAGALRQAEVGVAVVERIGIFSPASDVILDAVRLPQLARVLTFARRSVGVVKAGFAISTCYNVIGVGIAAAGLLAPIVCALLMPASSVTVVLFAIFATVWQARRTGLASKTKTGFNIPN